MANKEVTYAIVPFTVLDFLLISKMGNNDVQSLITLFIRRTNLTEEEILELQIEEVTIILGKIVEAAGSINFLN